jgi:hypothetical protein
MNTLRHRTITTAASAVAAFGAIAAGSLPATAATPPAGSRVPAASAKSAHVALTVLVTGKGRSAHLVLHERGVAVGGKASVQQYDIAFDGKAVGGADAGLNPCPRKPLQSFTRSEVPAAIHLTKGHHVIKVTASFCSKPGTNKLSTVTHTVGFTAH